MVFNRSRSANPAFNDDTFRGAGDVTISTSGLKNAMTVQGTVNKTGVLLGLCTMSAAMSWMFIRENPDFLSLIQMSGIITGFIIAIVTMWKKEWAPITAPLYAIAEGTALGALSLFFQALYEALLYN